MSLGDANDHFLSDFVNNESWCAVVVHLGRDRSLEAALDLVVGADVNAGVHLDVEQQGDDIRAAVRSPVLIIQPAVGDQVRFYLYVQYC